MHYDKIKEMHGLFLSYFDIILSIKQPRIGHIQFAYGYSLFVYICVQTADLSQGHITSPSLQVRSDKLFVGNGLHVRVCDWYNVVDVAAQHPDLRPLHCIYLVGIIVGSSNTQIVPLIIDRISSILLIPEELTIIKCNIHYEC